MILIKFPEEFKNSKAVPEDVMQAVYDEVKTPFKYGAVLKCQDHYTDCPSVFRMGTKWYMYYIRINKDSSSSGYDTSLAVSDDLLNWTNLGVIMSRKDDSAWDCKQIGGYLALPDIKWGGSNEPSKFNGKYYASYLGGGENGYEPDPLSMGLAYTDDITKAVEYERLPRPVLAPYDSDSRWFEGKTIYKSCMFEDRVNTTGYRFVCAYNGKHDPETHERIGLAVSNDMVSWDRYGENPVIDDIEGNPGMHISGDPQIVKWNDIYIMFYFKFKFGEPAYNTFACSYDLINWTKWQGDPLVKSEYDWENVHAHKCWILKDNGIVYHFYTAVNDKDERFIALAASENVIIK